MAAYWLHQLTATNLVVQVTQAIMTPSQFVEHVELHHPHCQGLVCDQLFVEQ